MDYSLGYIKDGLGFVVLIICFFVVYYMPNIQFLKPLILAVLALGALIDGIFTFFPMLHNRRFNVSNNSLGTISLLKTALYKIDI